jgi:large subunit ribosomal protein L23
MIRTEKATLKEKDNVYQFWVERLANKIQIKYAIEKIYNVKVKKVNIINMPTKKRRIRYIEGETSPWKKAIVSLKEGKIEVS